MSAILLKLISIMVIQVHVLAFDSLNSDGIGYRIGKITGYKIIKKFRESTLY